MAKRKWLRAAALAASAIVFEACGGNDGAYLHSKAQDRDTRDDELRHRSPDPATGASLDDTGSADAADAGAPDPQDEADGG